ncbi:hypothetical protein L226DRAFT_68022 [Lentinus tigrinus ALCF2SS1-7]|uniref:uncharacterized protein n=1 Tax=Lentinus tigrinus ALCF2SS1-7 TaxID=1328758 RepID=UPI0011663693|nr:hypothetical protein L226DRAFT_68022 [Lentinus tigrinus ALCF2SS1-7]
MSDWITDLGSSADRVAHCRRCIFTITATMAAVHVVIVLCQTSITMCAQITKVKLTLLSAASGG